MIRSYGTWPAADCGFKICTYVNSPSIDGPLAGPSPPDEVTSCGVELELSSITMVDDWDAFHRKAAMLGTSQFVNDAVATSINDSALTRTLPCLGVIRL